MFAAVAGLVAAGTAIAGAASGGNPTGAGEQQTQQSAELQAAQARNLDQQTAGLQRQQGIINSYLGGTTDPAFKAAVDVEGHNIKGDYINALNSAVTANRKSVARGGPGLFVNQERAPEDTYRALNTGFENSADQARNTVRGIYSTAAGLQGGNAAGFGSAAGSYGKAADALYQQGQQDITAANAGVQGGLAGLNAFSKTDTAKDLGNSLMKIWNSA